MKIALIGSTGMLGSAFSDEKVMKLSRSRLDITRPESISEQLSAIRPQAVINCAGITDIPFCQANPALAFQVNLAGVINLAAACRRHKIKLVQFSTVFAGRANIYTKTKMYMERALGEMLEDALILRLPWLFSRGEGDKKFLSTVVGCLKNGRPVPVYEDEVGSPTYAGDIADYVLANALLKSGVYDIANRGRATRKQWAIKTARILGYKDISFKPIKRKIPMKKNSAVKRGVILRPWEEALKECLG